MMRRMARVSATGPCARCFIASALRNCRGLLVELTGSVRSSWRQLFAFRGWLTVVTIPSCRWMTLCIPTRIVERRPSQAPWGSTADWSGTWSLRQSSVVERRDVCLRAVPLRAWGFDRLRWSAGAESVPAALVAPLCGRAWKWRARVAVSLRPAPALRRIRAPPVGRVTDVRRACQPTGCRSVRLDRATISPRCIRGGRRADRSRASRGARPGLAGHPQAA